MSMSRDARMRSAQSRRSAPLPRATNNILNDSPTCASQPRPNGPRTGRSALTQPEALAPPRTTSHLSERGGDRRREEASSVRIPLAHLRHERLSEHILLLVGLGTARLVEAVDDALRLAKVDRLQRVAHPVLHLLGRDEERLGEMGRPACRACGSPSPPPCGPCWPRATPRPPPPAPPPFAASAIRTGSSPPHGLRPRGQS
mmetsp:Transcript_38650/g.124019  ORF Transcript_38650/g.124019 Transcript_38650/m.124019 type:complete len:201 (+) Transcript_38650:522-1124(+)